MATAERDELKGAIPSARFDQGRIRKAETLNVSLCVDLDGTLIKTDTLIESVLMLLRNRPADFVRLPFWLAGGKARLKKEIAQRVELDVDLLPGNRKLIDHVRKQKEAGRYVALVTASNEKIANRVAERFGLFDDVLASDGKHNLRGAAKLKAMQVRYGLDGFDYAGNDRTDLRVWAHARQALIVNPDLGVEKAARDVSRVTQVFDDRPSLLISLTRVLRPCQWLRNLLLFVPLLIFDGIEDPQLLGAVFIGFLAFSLCTSAVYMINDILDLTEDRKHPVKRMRPFACGNLSLKTGLIMAPVLITVATLLGNTLSFGFGVVLGLYLLADFFSIRVRKTRPLVDVIVLSGPYVLRLIAGGVAAGNY